MGFGVAVRLDVGTTFVASPQMCSNTALCTLLRSPALTLPTHTQIQKPGTHASNRLRLLKACHLDDSNSSHCSILNKPPQGTTLGSGTESAGSWKSRVEVIQSNVEPCGSARTTALGDLGTCTGFSGQPSSSSPPDGSVLHSNASTLEDQRRADICEAPTRLHIRKRSSLGVGRSLGLCAAGPRVGRAYP